MLQVFYAPKLSGQGTQTLLASQLLPKPGSVVSKMPSNAKLTHGLPWTPIGSYGLANLTMPAAKILMQLVSTYLN